MSIPESSTVGNVSGAAEPTVPKDVVARWLRVLVEPDTVVELRAVEYARNPNDKWTDTISGFYDSDHLPLMAARGLEVTSKAEGVYFTLQPLLPEMLARRSNKAMAAKKGDICATDGHVLRRRWLLVDADPVRVKGISSTDAEKANAWEAIGRVRDRLAALGWPAPIVADSGNGYHLLYRVDLPAEDGGLTERALKALAAQFDSEQVKIDQTVFNRSRICKLYGTLARKGESVGDRPHRRAKILEIPGCPDRLRPDTPELVPVPKELLEALAAEAQEPGKSHQVNGHIGRNGSNGTYKHRLKVSEWLTDRSRGFKQSKTADGWDRWRLDCCPFDESHTGKDVAIFQGPNGELGAKCFHNSCTGRGWQEFKERIGKPEPHHWDPPMGPRVTFGGGRGAKLGDGEAGGGKADESIPREIAVGPLIIRPVKPRRTGSGKIVVGAEVYRADLSGSPLLTCVTISSTVSSWEDPARLLCQLEPVVSRDAVRKGFAEVVGVAAQLLERRDRDDASGPRVRDVVAGRVTEALQLSHRTEAGLWSEALGRDVRRHEVINYVPSWLVSAGEACVDVPFDEQSGIDRPGLIRLIKVELEVLWSDLSSYLPTAPDTELMADTAAGRAFRQAMVILWAQTATFEVTKRDEGDVAGRASLISRVRTAFRPYLSTKSVGAREPWREVQKAFSAWWRPHMRDGELMPLLAMRWELMRQIGCDLPGVCDQTSLTRLGERYGVLDPSPGVPPVLSGGVARLAILSPALTAELMENPAEWSEAPPAAEEASV